MSIQYTVHIQSWRVIANRVDMTGRNIHSPKLLSSFTDEINQDSKAAETKVVSMRSKTRWPV